MNIVILSGNVGKVIYATDKLIMFSIASPNSYKDKVSNEWVDAPYWNTVKVFHPTPYQLENIVKGAKLVINAVVSNNKADDKYEVQIVAKKIEFMNRKVNTGEAEYAEDANVPASSDIPEDINDDLPF